MASKAEHREAHRWLKEHPVTGLSGKVWLGGPDLQPTPSAHGGARPHAGRRPALTGQPAWAGRRITVYVAAEHVRLLRALGGGNVSLGLRRLMESAAQEAEPQEEEEQGHGH